MTAELALRFVAAAGSTRMRVETQQPPWKTIRAFSQPGRPALVHLHNISGGVLAGDHLTLRIHVGAGAQAQVTSTSATRLYRHRPGSLPSVQNTLISVESGSLLEYLPDSLIPFAGSRHTQHTEVQLGEGATMFWWEVIAPGRLAMGESFAFDSLAVETAVRSRSRPLLLEDFRLEPCRSAMNSIARMGPYNYVASFYALQEGRSHAQLRQLETELGEVARQHSRPGDMMWGASALASGGVVVRGLSTTAREIQATLARFWTTARFYLTGQDAIPPRKLK